MSTKTLLKLYIEGETATEAEVLAGAEGKLVTADVIAPLLGEAVPNEVVEAAVEQYFIDNPASGDVVGPASANDNRMAVFDGTSGKAIKQGPVLGDGALLDIGTGANTLAAGDDDRIVNALQPDQNLLELASPSVARENLGLEIGVDVPPNDDARIVGAAQKSQNGADFTAPYSVQQNLHIAAVVDPADGASASTSRAALDAAIATSLPISFPAAVYNFTGASQGGGNGENVYNVVGDKKPLRLTVNPEATFPGSVPSFQNSLPYQGYVFGFEGIARRYEPGEFAGAMSLNIFQTFSYCDIARPRSGGPGVVAVYGQARGSVSGASGWGANFVASASVDGAGGIGIEINTVNEGGNTGNVNGLVIKSAGSYQSGTAISIGSGGAANSYKAGIDFSTNSLIASATAVKFGVSTFANLIYAADMKLTSSELFLPSFRVAATSLTGGTRLDLNPGANPEFRVQGTAAAGATAATDASLILRGLGTGGVIGRDGGGTTRVQWNTTGVGFNAATPIAKPALGAAATDLATALTLVNNLRSMAINYGLATA